MLRLGILLDGAKPIGEGINGALRGFAMVGDEEISVVAKQLPEKEIICEILCAKLGLLLDLPIPEPLLLVNSQKEYLFGSTDIGYPNLAHYLKIEHDGELALKLLKKWVHLKKSSFFDELIFNADRHEGNILFDGATFSLIDHGLALHEGFPDDFKWNNILFSFMLNDCDSDSDRCKIKNDAKTWSDQLTEINIIDNIELEISNINSPHKETLINILTKRKKMLLSFINNRLPSQQMDYVNV